MALPAWHLWPPSLRRASARENLGQEVGDVDAGCRRRERCDVVCSDQVLAGAVGPAVERGGIRAGLAKDLEPAIAQVHDPVLGHSGSGVEAALELAIECQARFGDLDD